MDLVTGAMGSLASKLLQLLQDEYKLQKDVKEEVESLLEELESIHAVLRKVAEVPWDQLDKHVKDWARLAREASYDMEDDLDTILVRVEGREPADLSKLKRAMKKMINLFSKGKARHDIADTIEHIKKQLQKVAERHARYKVDEIVVTGVMGSLAPKQLQQLQDEYKLQKGVKAQVKSLLEELERIHATLRKVSEVPSDQLDELVKVWAREAREASYDMEDVLDTFLMRVEGREPTDPSKLKRAMKKMGNLFSKSKASHEMAGAIEDIMKKLQEVAERCAQYKVDEIVAKTAATISTIDPRLEAMYKEATQLVGIDKSRGQIISMLDDVSNKKIMKMVSIVGVGGLGKTTLAKASYDKLKSHYDCGAFVSVGKDPDLVKVFKNILFALDKHKYENIHNTGRGIDLLIRELQEFLEDKRYFIVIDDIREPKSWETIKLALVENNRGSRIITTTRNFKVAIEAGEVYKLQPLSYGNSKKLFYTRIFREEKSHDNQPDEVCDKIIEKCDGIPLAIITMASLLVGKSKEEWSELYSAIGFGDKNSKHVENTMRILSFSYYDLPSHLRTCLLYLSAYPEDFIIKKDSLIWKWIAEGFVHEREGRRLFEVGEGYFNDLINRSMIQTVEIDWNGIVYGCRVHDMVLHFIRILSHEVNFVAILDDVEGTILKSNARRLAYQNGIVKHITLQANQNGIVKHITHQANDMAIPKLRSLNSIGCPKDTIPPLSSFSVLRVLALENFGSMRGYNLEHLGKLLHLRFLGLRNSFVRKLPEEIGNLKYLQTLELEGSGMEELPASMGLLTQLKCLNADWKTRVPDWIGKLTSLEQLVMYPGGGDDEYSARWFVKELGNLTELRVLRFVIKVQDEGQMRDLLESLSNLRKIEVIHFDYHGVQLNSGIVLEPAGFVLSRHLRSLELRWLEFSRLPAWISPQYLPNLCRLWLMVFDMEEQDLEILGRFPCLRSLDMVIVNSRQGEIITSGGGAFRDLKFCSITKPLKFVQGTMPRLQVLDFHFNVRLLRDANHDFNFDFGLGNLPSIQQVIVQSNCLAAFPEEVKKAEDALSDAIERHPNHPTLEISLFGQGMKAMDADLRTMTRK
ncbi:disease resistance protein RGA5-like [Phragmites australis]|uniref:disease resistance protein RGA5-like n=1 Tax=Phragmites australis TaxID=29695 RepID=UPI002D79BB03|nr:disease resistance protein RGA5-like [Phragmites australis]XP_062197059.1 disease resistance protein RGA5-like [Phragmites australis]XP_062197060.1 disease resistance protein RGA5-like [Phragmites australis]